MATIVGEKLLSVSVKVLLEKIVSVDFVDNFRSIELDVSFLKKLKTTLMWVQDILNDDDVEEKRFTNPDVKNWLDMLRFAVFEVDCLFDAINSEASRRKVEAAYDILISSSFVLKSIFSPFKRLNTEMDSKRQKFIERLGWLNPAVQQGGLGVFNSSSVSHETPTSSILVDESSIYGRDFDIKKLKNILLSTDCGDSKMRMISIVEDASQESLSFLRSIKIWDCNELESFPPGGLPTLNLVYIAVWKCEKLRSLPEAMNTLISLQEMEIDNLPNLQSFVIDDLPISLQELTVGSVKGILWNTEPTWEHLTCLSVLRINGTNEKGKQQPTPNMLGLYLLNWRLIRQMVFATNFRGISRSS
ncbi:hypothetical protein P8452_24549 [Trifolium repens]|nr:hypothetical protein P8452_24549 [Trifolium repens]